MAIKTYRDLKVWKDAMNLAAEVQSLTKTFPRDEVYGLTSQIRRSAISVPSNIAEGYGRESTGSYVHFLKTARGSLNELETQLLLAERFGYVLSPTSEDLLKQADSLGRMLSGLIRAIQSPSADRQEESDRDSGLVPKA